MPHGGKERISGVVHARKGRRTALGQREPIGVWCFPHLTADEVEAAPCSEAGSLRERGLETAGEGGVNSSSVFEL